MALIFAQMACRRCMHTTAVRDTSSKQTRQAKATLERMLRVDHAGEYGAVQIYKGQMAVLGRHPVGPLIQEMCNQEKHHLATFEKILPEYRVRPTAFLPIWNIAGFVLGASTALLGKEGAMACTVAVEEVIGNHYNDQIRTLMADGEDGATKHKDLLKVIKQFRDEELEHHDTGLEHDAEKAPMYDVLTNVIKVGCKGAIWISERV